MTGEPLSWWIGLDAPGRYRASGHSGIYAVTYHREWSGGGCWNAEHQRGRRVQQLGVTKTAEQAMALAQRDHDRGGDARR
jgi:hypothetical protein